MIQGDNSHEVLRIENIGSYQIGLLILGILVLFADGFDAQMTGYTAPAIAAAWHVASAAFAPIFAANVAGLMIGSMSITTVSDMFGRKWIITICVGIFGLTSLATAAASQLWQLGVIRFISGLALGGAMPCMIAATSDYFPARYRTRLGVAMSTAWSLGIAVCGLTTGAIVETRGWQFIFILGGVLPILMVPAIYLLLPESPAYLAKRGRIAELNGVLKRISPTLVYQPHPVKPLHRFPVASLFQGILAKVTPLVWAAYFFAGATIYFFLNWLPIFVRDAGYSPAQAAYVTSMYQIGGLIGGFVVSYLVDRKGPGGLAVSLFLASIVVTLLGVGAHSLLLLASATMAAGFFVVGSQNTANAYTGSSLYPSEIRATGLGWALGWVRLSGVLAGSLGVGFLLTLNLGPAKTLLIIAVPEVLAALAFFGVYRVLKRDAASR